MSELTLPPGTSAQEAVYAAVFRAYEAPAPSNARAIGDELIAYLAKLEQDAHRSIFDKPKPNLPPQAIGFVQNTAMAGYPVIVITRTGEVLDLGPEQTPPYAGEDLTAGE